MNAKSKYIKAIEVYREYEYEKEINTVRGLPTMVFDCWCKDKDMGSKASKKIYNDIVEMEKEIKR